MPCRDYSFSLLGGLVLAWVLVCLPSPGWAKAFFKGAKVCRECHEEEFKVWKETKHFKSFRNAHREPKEEGRPSPKKILAAVKGSRNMKKNKTCNLCHYTMVQKNADAKRVAKSGTSCESCHGASSDWLRLHDDYGGKNINREDETPKHKAERYAASRAAELIWPNMKYDVAKNCMTCHGLAHPGLTAEVLGKMLDAGHPINPDFELVKYSQGSIRHRFYAPHVTTNAEMSPPQLAELFVIGQAAKLVSALAVLTKSENPKYRSAQEKRASDSRAALSALRSVPEAAAFIKAPNEKNARKLIAAIAGKNLTREIGNLLPKNKDYK
ncbi:MAG: cytochrome c family protein [Nitrospinaceae bacterium]